MSNADIPAWIVRLEFQRIQTFLFAVPRLRSMLGANAMLGHAIRSELPGLAKAPGRQAQGFQWPTEAPSPLADDPLAAAREDDWTAADDPAQALAKGVLARDGGHLRIVFPDEPQADAFMAEARRYLTARFPDLLFTLDRFPAGAEPPAPNAQAAAPIARPPELPQFQVCTRSGFGVATGVAKKGRAVDGYVSAATQAKEEAGREFQQGDLTRRDTISLLRDRMPRYDSRTPRDLEELADAGGYIALIHADGNRVGQRLKAHAQAAARTLTEPRWLAGECSIEAFFHRMRGTVRTALLEALQRVFTPEVLAGHDHLPYQLLMLGGDDLLLLCHPCYALPFLTHYAAGLEQRPLLDGQPLSIGAGVVIAKHSLPFHRLHQLSETLAASAKRTYLQRPPGTRKDAPPPERSAVDWTVVTSSWGEDPLAHRRRHDLIRYPSGDSEVALALTAKPYFILDSHATLGGQWAPSLESLLRIADDLGATDELPRSQFKDMIRHLEGGQGAAELAYGELLDRLPERARTALATLLGGDSPWRPVLTGPNQRAAVTQLKDLIECLELRYLGRRKQEQDHD